MAAKAQDGAAVGGAAACGRTTPATGAPVAGGSGAPHGRYSRHQEGSFTSEDIIAALRYFRRKVGRPLTIVWDGLNQHHSAETLDFVARHPEDFRLERLPGYAPDLNPEEGCNGVVRAELRNATPDSVAELRAQARASFMRLGHRHDVLAAFFHHAGLSLT